MDTRKLLATVADSMILHGFSAWADKILLSTQKNVAIESNRAFKTIPMCSVITPAKMIATRFFCADLGPRRVRSDIIRIVKSDHVNIQERALTEQ